MQQTVGGDDVVEGLGFALGIDGSTHVFVIRLINRYGVYHRTVACR